MKRSLRMITLIAALGLIPAAPSTAHAEPDAAARQRTVALFTFRKDGDTLRFATALNGVMVSPRHVITSGPALRRGPSTLFGSGGEAAPDRILAVVTTEDEPIIFRVTILPAGGNELVQVLEVSAEDRAAVAKAIDGAPKLADVEADPPHGAVGVFAPLGLTPEAVDAAVVPAPYEVALRPGGAAGLTGVNVEAMPLHQTLPAQLAGAGVWSGGKLWGLLVRHEGTWWIVDHSQMKAAMKTAMPADSPTVVTPTPTPIPKPPDPTPPTPAVRVPKSPPIPEPMQRLIAEAGAKPVLDSGLIDYVKQDQADMAMAQIAAGKPTKALQLIEDILFLARDRLAEQLVYRRALALIVMGEAKKALGDAQKGLTAQDPQVRGRSYLLAAALDLSPDGQFDGKPLSDPAALKAAAIAALYKIEKRTADKVDAVTQLKPTDDDAKAAALERIDAVLEELNAVRYAWPGYFDEMGKALADHRAAVAAGPAEPAP